MLLKKILLLLSFSFFISTLMAQKKLNTYQQSWNKIDTLINKKGLIKTALDEVNKIYLNAKKEKNDPQIIKALLYRMPLYEQLSDTASLQNIADLEKEITTSKEPATSILYSITAEAYWSYLQQNRWKLYSRTATAGYDKKDLATWGIDDLHRKISELYLSSIQQEKKLQQTLLEPYAPIIVKGNTRYLRPTLFDMLGHRALDYFTNDERDIQKPSYAFEITDKEAFAGPTAFAAHLFTAADSLSLHYKALQLFQRLIRFHLPDAKPDALIDVDIARIRFVHSFGTQENKNELYKQALQNLIEKYPASAAQARYLLAEWYVSLAAGYDPLTDTANRYAYLEAKNICRNVLTQKEESQEKYNCAVLLRSIERKEIRIQAEKVSIPNDNFRILLTYRNTPAVYFRIVDMSKKKHTRETWKEDYWKELLKLPAIRSFSNTLPDTKDHQQHRIELKVDGLPTGEYALIASTEKSFSLQNSIISLQSFYVSNLSYINKDNRYYVLHRESGAPIPAANVQVWRQRYDYSANKYILQKDTLLVADKNGFFKMPDTLREKNASAIRLEITTNNDRLFLDDQIYTYNYRPGLTVTKEEKEHSFLFADRALYRPGQIVYFKGIKILRAKNKNETSVVSNSKSTIILYNANREPVDSITLTTNEFGSYAGKFTLPSSGLNGQFTLRDNTSENEIYFAVEEYKRPKFYVEIPKPAGTYKLLDSIQLEGFAKAYAGNNINNATVNYRVTRKSIIPFYAFSTGYLPKIWPPYRQQQAEIAHGITSTDGEGMFRITFIAQPDNTIDKKNQPLFYYEVNADITDINGETRSGATSIAIAYQAIKLKIDAPEKISADSLKTIRVLATNMNDAEETTPATIAIHRLAAPSKVFRERYWSQPDQFIMSREEYYRQFPYDLYADENEITNWAKEDKVFEAVGPASSKQGFALKASSWKSGWYLIEASAIDKYGETVTSKHYLQLYNPELKSSVASGNIEIDRPVAAPAETVRYRLNTNLDNVFVIHELAGKTIGGKTDYLTLNNNSRAFDIKITEDDRGVILMNMSFVKHNRVYSDQRAINIPFSNKELSIDYITYRDKTLPGANEQWKIKIRGHNKDKAAAEVLMTMYDASLDQFYPHQWITPSVWSTDISLGRWSGRFNFSSLTSIEKHPEEQHPNPVLKQYDRLNTSFAAGLVYRYDMMSANRVTSQQRVSAAAPGVSKEEEGPAKKESVTGDADATGAPEPAENKAEQSPQGIQIRKNFNETAFFFPQLQTDAEGNLEFSFSAPEALTQWKWMLLAHDKALAFGYGEKQIVTQKPLMVQPNAPRFLREGDRMDFSAKIVNLSDREITGQVELQLIDPSTGQSVDGYFKNVIPNQYFTAGAGQSAPVRFSIDIPFQYNKPVTYRIIASADITDSTNHTSRASDGEESLLPVIANRMLVTETLPLPVRGAGAHHFRFDKLLQSGGSETLQHHSLSVEFTANPAWYAVQALPYLAENVYDNAEQFFNRYYANALAVKIANASPRLREIVEQWKNSDTTALLSALQKNEELKNVLLEETPWVLDAKTESQQKKNIALLFDMVRMSGELESTLLRLQEFQSPNGGFVWFKGGPDDRYMTQYILSGIGRLKNMQAIPENGARQLETIVQAGLSYLDKKIKEDYETLKKRHKTISDLSPDYLQVQYLYMRSFFKDSKTPGDVVPAYRYYRDQAKKYWLKQSRYMQGMIALSLSRSGDVQTAKNILASIKQYATVNNEMGMYWKDMIAGYYWYQAPVEMHALMIEAFTEITNDIRATDDLKTWLIKNKQTNHWKTSKATADACYALLLQGTDWMANAPEVTIKMGELTISSADNETLNAGKTHIGAIDKTPPPNARPLPQEAGTGYFKRTIEGPGINPSMGNIEVTLSQVSDAETNSPAWGAVYWQYFENLDKITTASTPLALDKKLFVEKNTDRGPVLEPLNAAHTLYIGDKVRVRIELKADRDMEYVHMKDMRAACMEPVNVISRYNWQGGLGYYETTRDASASFFFNYLRKGTYVFEYTLFVTHTGTFSNGITVIQSMYAPEFSSHSEGIKVNVEDK